MKIIRASEISSYSYCHRAWWYQLQGYQSDNQTELVGGSQYHDKHGRGVLTGGCFTTLAYVFLILAVVALTIWLVGIII